MTTGDLFKPGFRYPLMRAARVDAQQAARITLRDFLKRQTFVIGAGEDGKEVAFNLKHVSEQSTPLLRSRYRRATSTRTRRARSRRPGTATLRTACSGALLRSW